MSPPANIISMTEPTEESVFTPQADGVQELPTRWRKDPEPPPPDAGAEMRQAGIDADLYGRDDCECINVERGQIKTRLADR
jgi:hypothetical protein